MMAIRFGRIGLVLGMIAWVAVSATAVPLIEVGIAPGVGMLDDEPVGEISVVGGVRVARRLDVQVGGTAVHTLERSYDDAAGNPYQAESAWVMLGVRPFVEIGERLEIGLPLRTGSGIVQFRYERPYRNQLAWDDELVDREQVAVLSAGVDARLIVTSRWSVTGELGGRTSSPIRTVVEFDRDALTSFYGGIGTAYRLGL